MPAINWSSRFLCFFETFFAANCGSFGGFDDRLGSVALDEPAVNPRSTTRVGSLDGPVENGWQVPVNSAREIGTAFHEILAHRLSARYGPLGLWCHRLLLLLLRTRLLRHDRLLRL